VHSLGQMHHRLKNHFWTHPVVVHGEEARVKAWFGLFGGSAHLDGRYVHGLRRMYH
jgi:hypothetical protein